jgi:hypothetical protein
MTGNPYIFGRLSRFQIKLVTPFAVCPIWCHRAEQHIVNKLIYCQKKGFLCHQDFKTNLSQQLFY